MSFQRKLQHSVSQLMEKFRLRVGEIASSGYKVLTPFLKRVFAVLHEAALLDCEPVKYFLDFSGIPYNVTWYDERTGLELGGEDTDTVIRGSSLLFLSTKMEQQGHYLCIVSDLQVAEGWWLERSLLVSRVEPGDFNLNFTCRALSHRGNAVGYFTLHPADPDLRLPIILLATSMTSFFVSVLLLYRVFKVELALLFRALFPFFYASTDGDGKLYDAYVVYPRDPRGHAECRGGGFCFKNTARGPRGTLWLPPSLSWVETVYLDKVKIVKSCMNNIIKNITPNI
ncbi:Interleukin-1 receptor-like 1 [Bagarius yarrelli]|uniref:Interleukin-1 receptor-like 1 n=1 Tax=Bagarius yarrelli TaxID=175774 RepID=A0A556VW30_BAGYA|nr:Interleukin-1 receptor-like 1 [Bagarius yarrelli]